MIPAWVRDELEALRASDSYRTLRPLEGPCGARVRVGGREMLCFSSNDYLGLAADSRLAEGAARTARRWGAGAGASRLITGTLGLHAALEQDLARLKGCEAAVLFNSGYQANLGVLTALGRGGVILSDELNHASIVDGCRLARARVEVYRHADPADLERRLRAHAGTSRKVVVTDGVFSMDGDLAPLPEIVEAAQEHGAVVVVDDAHATGVVGGGRGTAHHFGIRPEGLVVMGTLGKALGAFGAFVAGPKAVRDLLVNRARSLIYTTAIPPPVLGAAGAALEVLGTEPERVERLAANTRRLRRGLQEAGFAVPDLPTPIVPVILGGNRAALAWSERLWERGFWVHPIRPPTVPEGTSRLRITVSSEHDPADIDALTEALADLLRSDPAARQAPEAQA